MSKFKNIKTGDFIYVKQSVKLSFRNSKSFFVPKKIERVTATQFVVEGGKKFNKDGAEIGVPFSRAMLLGEKVDYFGDELVCDESEEMRLFLQRLSIEKNINELLYGLDCKLDSGLSIAELEQIYKSISDIRSKLKPTE